MMKTLFKIFFAFLAITGAVALLTHFSEIDFGSSDYWEHHGVFFLVAITIFPRLTLLFGGVATGGVIWWLSWFFAPRLLVAFLATIAYWNSNPWLVAISWVVALGGESSEKFVVVSRSPGGRGRRGFDQARWVERD